MSLVLPALAAIFGGAAWWGGWEAVRLTAGGLTIFAIAVGVAVMMGVPRDEARPSSAPEPLGGAEEGAADDPLH